MSLSVIIPSRTEKYLNRTIQDVLEKATGEIDIFPILDGYGDTPYKPIIDPRVKYISLPDNGQLQKRQGINAAVSISKATYLMSLDAHCCVAKGFDEVLAADCEDNWVVVPRRCRLDIENWTGTNWEKPPIDYEYFMWQKLVPGRNDNSKHLKAGRFAGYHWDLKTLANMDKPIDDIFTCQASGWFMKKSWFQKCGFMNVERYTGWGQEGEEICLETIFQGGRAVVNKKTWYAHLHKGQTHGRMYDWRIEDIRKSYDNSYDYWVNQHKEFFISLMEKFWPIPNFPDNWKDILWTH